MEPTQQQLVLVSFFRGSLAVATEDIELDDANDYVITDIEYAVAGGSGASELILSELAGGAAYFVLAAPGGASAGDNAASWQGEMLISGAGFHVFASVVPMVIAITGFAVNPTANTIL